MHHGATDLQDLDTTAARRRRLAAAVALIAGVAAPAAADEPVRPAVTRSGWQLELSGYLQVDAVPWAEDSVDEVHPVTGEPLATERFLIRRGRLRADARRDGVFGALELDGNTVDRPTARIVAAQVGYAYPAREPLVTVSAGLFKTPFGVQVPASDRERPFLEPPAFARALFPGSYDAGVVARGRYGLARWTIALVNGAPVGDAQWRGKDPSSSYDVVGRIGAVVEGPLRLRVEAGVSGLAGSALHPGTPPTKDEVQWVDENQDGLVQPTELHVVPGSAGTPSESFDHRAIGGDVQLHWCICKLGNGAAFVEAALASNLDRGLVYADPIANDRELRHFGFTLGFVQEVTPHALVGARYDRYDADRDAIQRAGLGLVGVDKVFSTLSVMATGRWHDARFVVQYDHERNPFGRADDGTPTTRDADRVTLRAQVGF